MENDWRDVSIPMRPEMTVWPGDPKFSFEPASRMADGASCNVSHIAMATHTGTHCDAPWHFVDDGATLDEVDPRVFFGAALLIELPGVDLIRAADLPETALPPRVLFKTRNSNIPMDGEFDRAFVALDEGAAERLVADGVQLVGIDYLSIAPFGKGRPVHHILLSAGVFVVEGLRLADIPPGTHEFIVLPLPIADADGAPCRAFLRPGG